MVRDTLLSDKGPYAPADISTVFFAVICVSFVFVSIANRDEKNKRTITKFLSEGKVILCAIWWGEENQRPVFSDLSITARPWKTLRLVT